jgi:hypothetical protein
MFFFLFLSVPAIFGSGRRDEALSRADQLIAEKQYDQAISLLADYMKKNPNKFDQAQSRVQIILKFRDEYNRTAEELLTTLENEPDNNPKILALSNHLIELDPARTAETEDLINRIQHIALFRNNQRRLEEILARGRNLIAQGSYVEALRTYERGLDIYQREFFNAGYGADLEIPVRQGIDDLTGSIPVFSSLVNPLSESINALEGQRNQGIEQSGLNTYTALYGRVGTELDNLTALRDRYRRLETLFMDRLELVHRMDPLVGDRTFLSFAIKLFEGYADEPKDGMNGVLDSLWDSSAARLEEILAAKLDTVYQRLYAGAVNGEYAYIGGQAEILSGYSALPLDLVDRGGRYDPVSPRETLPGGEVASGEAGEYLKYQSMRAGSEYLRGAGTLGLRFLSLAANGDPVAAWRNGGNAEQLILQEQTRGRSLRQLESEAGALSRAVQDEIGTYEPYKDRSQDDILVYLTNAGSVIDNLLADITGADTESAARRYTIAGGMAERQLVQHEEAVAQAQTQLQGELMDGSFVSKHPSSAVSILDRMNAVIDTDTQSLQTMLTQMEGEDSALLEREQLSPLYRDALEMRRRFESARSGGRTMLASARSLAAQAESLRREGERYYTEAQAALARENFDTARERLNRAENSYNSSLVIEDSSSLRQERDSTLRSLDTEISRRENEVVIRTVNQLISDAGSEYTTGNLEQAEDMLTRAQSMWRRTQTVENQEITNWLSVIRSARSLRSGRIIPATAPLYAEMSQLLSEAQRNFEEGQSLYSSSLRTEGRAKLDNAKVSTQKVRLMYPFNEEAGLLDLRIDRVLDPRAFEETFAVKVAAAITGTRRRDMQAYADLLNLFAINRQYPNREAILYQAEVDMGYRPPPPSQDQLARSNELTAQARNIINNYVSAQYDSARNNLNEAILLNPNNQAAKDLSSALARRMAATTIFDTGTDRKYQQAVVYFQQNNYLQSYQLAAEIARDPRYSQNTKVTDLLKRLQDRMR